MILVKDNNILFLITSSILSSSQKNHNASTTCYVILVHLINSFFLFSTISLISFHKIIPNFWYSLITKPFANFKSKNNHMNSQYLTIVFLNVENLNINRLGYWAKLILLKLQYIHIHGFIYQMMNVKKLLIFSGLFSFVLSINLYPIWNFCASMKHHISNLLEAFTAESW